MSVEQSQALTSRVVWLTTLESAELPSVVPVSDPGANPCTDIGPAVKEWNTSSHTTP